MTYIICEVGSNWSNFEDTKDSVSMAKACGASAVKFQLYTGMELYGKEGAVAGEMPREWLPKLKEKADACAIDFMCTSFSPDGLRYVDPFVKAHKIASSEISYTQLLEAAKATGKPIYLSVGASSWGDIKEALRILAGAKVTLMYCAVEYPSKWHNLRLINTLKERFSVPVGLSDHSFDIYTPVTAAHVHGAVAIEKHFKLRDDFKTPDAPHSLNPQEFIHMVELIKDKNAVMKMPNPGEREAVMRHKRRLVVTEDIKVGEPFDFDVNFGTYRLLADDSHGLGGFSWQAVNGKLALKDLNKGQTIGPGDF
jgi:N,N'-diacetyllegionaminate synthase